MEADDASFIYKESRRSAPQAPKTSIKECTGGGANEIRKGRRPNVLAAARQRSRELVARVKIC